MRKLKKRLAALGVGLAVMATSVMSLGASALEYDEVWPAYYTPYRGAFSATKNYVSVDSLAWSTAQLNRIKQESTSGFMGVEFEFRPQYTDGSTWHPAELWVEQADEDLNGSSNLPSAHYEFDENDVSICCRRVTNCVPNTYYYGSIQLTPLNAGIDLSQNPYIFECELGIGLEDGPGILKDHWPLRYNQYRTQKTYFNRTYSWLN